MASRNRSGLKEAYKHYRARQFAELIRLLEPQVFLYRDNIEFYHLLGMSCLFTGDAGGAHSYLSRCMQLDPDHTNSMLGLAAAHLKRRETQEALRLWLEVLDSDPGNAKAKRGLNLVRSAESEGEILEKLNGGELYKLVPTPGFRIPGAALWAVAAIVVGTAAFLFGPPLYQELADRVSAQREGADVVELEASGDALLDYSGQFRVVLNEAELQSTMKDIQSYFNNYRDNMAMREINRVLNSNAAATVKQKVLLLSDYLSPPTFTDFRDNFTYADVTDQPWLYDGCWVRWRGRVSNLDVGSDEITFDFLVGYEDQRVLEGVVTARLDFAAEVEPGSSVELIGRVVGGERLEGLQVTSVRPIRPQGDS